MISTNTKSLNYKNNKKKIFYNFIVSLDKKTIKHIKYIKLKEFCSTVKDFVKIPHLERCQNSGFCEICKEEYRKIGIKYNIGHTITKPFSINNKKKN